LSKTFYCLIKIYFTMKLQLKHLLALFLIAMATMVTAQDYVFRVLANKGTNKFKKGSTGQILDLKTGTTLGAGDVIMASEGAYIGLMHKTGKTIEVRKAGNMAVVELEKQIKTGKTTAAQRMADFVADKMSEDENSSYKSRMAATGAISRGVEGKINVFVGGETNEYLGESAILKWKAIEEIENPVYVITITDIGEETIYSRETTETMVTLDFNSQELKDSKNLYIVTISLKGDPEFKTTFGLKQKTGSDAQQIKADLAILQKELASDSPLNRLIYASFFEEKGLLLDALTQYEAAVSQAPDVPDFVQMYENFLIVSKLMKLEEK
jgi:hypothetical protein